MANLSQAKRQKMLDFLNAIREEHKDDESVLIAINEIENELTRKKYGLIWEEHAEAVDAKLTDNVPVFLESAAKELTAAGSCELFNFILEGDNLHSLILLNKTSAKRIDVIYIDPPYNLGGDFVYDDNYIEKEDSFKHSKWLSFMERRLKVAFNLLSNSGCILISINDAEYAGLKFLCDEIFGDYNYQGTFIWHNRQRADSRNLNMISTDHEYVLLYSKSNNFAVKGRQKDITKYKNPDNDPRGPWARIDLSELTNAVRRTDLNYDIDNWDKGVV